MYTDLSAASAPQVTVFTSHYNVRPKYLRRAVESILNQTFGNFEYIISDNRSTDGTAAILDEYAGMDGRVKILHRAENDPVVSWEDAVLHLAKGKYLVILDNDDYYDPNFLEEMLRLETETHADMISCGTEMFQEGSPAKQVRAWRSLYVEDYAQLKPVFSEMVWMAFATQWCKLFKTDILRAVLQSDTLREFGGHYHDTMLCLAYALHSSSFAISPKVMHHYRMRPASQVRTWNQIQVDWAGGTYILFSRFLRKWELDQPENMKWVRGVYRTNILQILEELKDIKPQDYAKAFANLSQTAGSRIFADCTRGAEGDRLFQAVLSESVSLMGLIRPQGETEKIEGLFLYRICGAVREYDQSGGHVSASSAESFLQGFYAQDNSGHFGRQLLPQVIRACSGQAYEIFSQCDTDFIMHNPDFLRALIRGADRLPLVRELKTQKIIQKYAPAVALILEGQGGRALPLLFKACGGEQDAQSKIALLKTAHTVAAAENDAQNFILAGKRIAECHMRRKEFEAAASAVLELEEMIPNDEDVLAWKVGLLMETGRTEPARSLAREICAAAGFSAEFKERIRRSAGISV